MELYHLRTFVTVAREGNLTRASERLFTSQPAVSAHVKALEEELGVTLFDRTPRGMRLTAEGERLLARAERVLDGVSAFAQEARTLKGEISGVARIALNTGSEYLRLSDLHAHLSADHPGVSLELLQGNSADNLEGVKRRLLTGAFFFGRNPHPEVATCHLTTTRLTVAAPPGWAVRIADAGWRDLATLPWVFSTPRCPFRSIMDSVFSEHAVEPPRSVVVDDEESLRAMVAAGVGLTLMREDEARDAEGQGKAVVWPHETWPLALGFAYHRKRESDPVVRAIVTALEAIWDVEEGDDTLAAG